MIRFVVRLTAALLGASSVLVIVGLFDAFLGWDIFGPTIEAVGYGLFFSCITLAASGIALTFVLGIHEIVLLLRSSQEGISPPTATDGTILARRFAWAGTGIAALLALLALANHQVQAHRSSVYQGLASSHAERFAPKVLPYLADPSLPATVPSHLEQAMSTLQNMELFQNVELYLPDPVDKDALWVYHRRYGQNPPHFERRFAARTYETAITQTLAGDSDALDEFNEDAGLQWLHSLSDGNTPRGILYLVGQPHQSFRAYSK